MEKIEKGQVWDCGTRGQAKVVRRCKNEDHPTHRSFLMEWKGGVRSVWREDSFRSFGPKLLIPAEPKEIPEDLLCRQRWAVYEAGIATIYNVDWDKEKGDYEVWLQPDDKPDADMITLMAKELRSHAIFVQPRRHDFSDPYVRIGPKDNPRCVACGSPQVPNPLVQQAICTPSPGWRERMEASLAQSAAWTAEYAELARAKKAKTIAPQPGFLQSHNLGAGIGVFSLRDESAAIKVGPELARVMKPPMVRLVDSTEEPF